MYVYKASSLSIYVVFLKIALISIRKKILFN